MTYASDLFSWYAGSVDRTSTSAPSGTAPTTEASTSRMRLPSATRATASANSSPQPPGSALCDTSKGYVTQSQATLMSSLVDTQRNNLYAGTTNVVQVRTQISTLLRSLLTSTAIERFGQVPGAGPVGHVRRPGWRGQLQLRQRLRAGYKTLDGRPEDQARGPAEVDHVRHLRGRNAFRLFRLHHTLPLLGPHHRTRASLRLISATRIVLYGRNHEHPRFRCSPARP